MCEEKGNTYSTYALGDATASGLCNVPAITSKLLLLLEVQKKCLNYDDLCSKMHLFQTLFLDFQIQQLAILKPVEVGKSYIPQKKAL